MIEDTQEAMFAEDLFAEELAAKAEAAGAEMSPWPVRWASRTHATNTRALPRAIVERLARVTGRRMCGVVLIDRTGAHP